MARMVRKQIYIAKRRELVLKRLARARGASEAEIIREAIDWQGAGSGSHSAAPDPAALNIVVKFALARRRHGSTAQSLKVDREERYEKQLSQFDPSQHRS